MAACCAGVGAGGCAATSAALLARARRRNVNVDFGMVALGEALGLRPGFALFTFSVGRLAGWISHVREQRTQDSQRRPRARYVGPPPRS